MSAGRFSSWHLGQAQAWIPRENRTITTVLEGFIVFSTALQVPCHASLPKTVTGWRTPQGPITPSRTIRTHNPARQPFAGHAGVQKWAAEQGRQ